MSKKKSIPPYLAIMMLNPCEVTCEEKKTYSEKDEEVSICAENAPLMGESTNIPFYDPSSYSPIRRVHIKSWAILLTYFLLAVTVNSSWCLFASISSPLEEYYNVSPITASTLSMTYPLMFVLTGSFVQRLLHTYSPSALLLLAAFLHALGAAVRCKGTNRDGFGILLLGQGLCGLAVAPTLCLSYSIHILCHNYRTRGFTNAFIIATNIVGVASGYLCSSFAVTCSTNADVTGWEIYRFTLWLAVLSVFILVLVPFTLKGLSLSLSLDEYDPSLQNKTIKSQALQKHLVSVTLIMSRMKTKDVLRNAPLQLIVNAFGLCFADAYIYITLLSKILQQSAGLYGMAKVGIVASVSLVVGLLSGVLLRSLTRFYPIAKHVLLLLVCQSAVFDLMFVILHRFQKDEATVLALYCISQVSSVAALIVYADQISSIRSVPTGISTFALLLYACIYGLLAALIASVVLTTLGETPMLAVTEVSSLAAILLTYFFPKQRTKSPGANNNADSVTDDLIVNGALSRRDSLEGNSV